MKRNNETYLHEKILRSNAEEPIKVCAGDAAARPVPVQKLVEPQLHDLVVLALESIHAAGKSVVACTNGIYMVGRPRKGNRILDPDTTGCTRDYEEGQINHGQ